MAVQINSKIKSFAVVKPEDKAAAAVSAPAAPTHVVAIDHMGEHIDRPEFLVGSTYKIKPGSLDHAMYITINDIVLNEGTVHEQKRPFEIFINSKNMDEFQWVVALTRIMSAVFRKGGDITFLVDEMKAVFDPKGGYWKPGGVYMPSLIADIGTVVETHLKAIGLLKGPELDQSQKDLIAAKRAQFEATGSTPVVKANAANDQGSFPPGATLCAKCNTQALVLLDGCQTCLNCGYSKCG